MERMKVGLGTLLVTGNNIIEIKKDRLAHQPFNGWDELHFLTCVVLTN